MVMTVSNSFGSKKMVFKDFLDLILSEEIRQRKLGETSSYTLTSNPEVDPMIETQIEVDQNQDEASLNLQRKRLATKIAVRMAT